jgi:hypothetical protein
MCESFWSEYLREKSLLSELKIKVKISFKSRRRALAGKRQNFLFSPMNLHASVPQCSMDFTFFIAASTLTKFDFFVNAA